MKRKHSSEQFSSEYAIKDPLARKRSPNFNKPKSKSKLQQTLFLGLGKGKVNHSKQEITNKESNNSTTNCTYVRPRNTKTTKKQKQRQEIISKESKLKQSEIMNIINTFAVKIQRQWRVHQLRAKFKLLLKQSRDEKKRSVGQRQGIQRHSNSQKMSLNVRPEKHLKYLEDSNIEQNDTFYDHQKYEKSSLSSIVQSREVNNSIEYLSEKNKHEGECAFSSIEIKVPFKKEGALIKQDQVRRSLGKQRKNRDCQEGRKVIKSQVCIQSKSIPKVPDVIQILSTQLNAKQINDRRASYDYCKAKQFSEARRHSTGQVEALGRKQLKCLQIDKAFEIRIDKNQQGQKPEQKDTKTVFQIKSKGELSSRLIRRVDNDKNAFNIKFPLDKVLRKYKKQLQIAKLKKLLSIENRFNRNEITERLYSQTITKINEQHRFKLQEFNEREVSMKSNWLELLNIHKISNLKLSHKYLEDAPDLQNSASNIDVSTSFERWDFNSSAKKSIDCHLDFTENAPQNSKIMSIESVLKELEEEDKEKEEGDRKFKRNRSLQMIEAIAERSKEGSEKEMDSVRQIAELNLESQKKDTQHIIIEDVYPFELGDNGVQSDLFTPKLQNREKFIQIQVGQAEKKYTKGTKIQEQMRAEPNSEAKSDGQSLLISSIQILSPHQCINSDPSFSNIEDKNALKDLLFRDFKTSHQRSQTQLKGNSIDGFIEQEESQLLQIEGQRFSQERGDVNLSDPLIRKFRDFVDERIILNSLKTVNSMKFILAKLSEHIKINKLRVQASTDCPRMETDISAINSWLLEISHFMLDKYKAVLLDNLVDVKQPPGQELLELSKTNGLYYKIYRTIPETVFKDFQFYYIKNLADNAKIAPQKFDIFSSLLYTFHRLLVDCLNISLMDELATNRNWLTLPWKTVFRKKRRVVAEHAKVCLQRSINLVSNWGEFGLGRLDYQDEMDRLQNTQYEEQKIMLVCRQQAFDIPLSFVFTESHMLLLLTQQIFSDEMALAVGEISALI